MDEVKLVQMVQLARDVQVARQRASNYKKERDRYVAGYEAEVANIATKTAELESIAREFAASILGETP